MLTNAAKLANCLLLACRSAVIGDLSPTQNPSLLAYFHSSSKGTTTTLVDVVRSLIVQFSSAAPIPCPFRPVCVICMSGKV
jgi:hypothetical protein